MVLVLYRVLLKRFVVFEARVPERERLYAGGNVQLALELSLEFSYSSCV